MLDVHKSQVTACVRVPDGDGGRRQEVREFRTTTAGLITLADWLRSWAVTVVGMESTGVYWRAIYYLVEDEFECQLFNARHLRHVPGRKSDVQDAEWGCQLIEHGLVRTSFVPPRPLRELRDLVRYRKAKIQERGREVQRVEKTLQDAGIKLSSVASEVLGKSARLMLDAMEAIFDSACNFIRCPPWRLGGFDTTSLQGGPDEQRPQELHREATTGIEPV